MVTDLKTIIFGLLITFKTGYGQDFGYDGNTGPDFWGLKYQGCNGGKLQSPIDIELNNVTEKEFPPLVFQHFDEPLETVKLENNGHTALLSIKQGKIPNVRGGPLNETYNFSQLHFHWGRTDDEGSENLVNNQSFPLELHMVLYNTKYGNFSNALYYDDGLTVLSFLYHKTIKQNQHYQKFERELPAVENLNATVDIIGFVSLDNFTTTDRNEYFTYKGSLTTPPCSEVVTWLEFINTIPLSHEQIQEFRFLSGARGKLNHNFRPAQARNDRSVYMNIPTLSSTASSSNDRSSSKLNAHSKNGRSSSGDLRSNCGVFVLLMFKYFYYIVN
ncbi:unnamed protein product [Psylliodes chrysocephalus]|uniref:Carbonic anhydrase n=1 Tax=Psylliodes chrysocephalus TaxID=3402493 RepID=A0A9P0D3H1_9CUCU|nr:unnamed protein product [Psylliodes chrysocephala]